ncbi:MAG: hypothetical protein JO112_17010, partial [Planctomycetes bacterium]|nr:hypothetical protein [Planctomycetota bacterium]
FVVRVESSKSLAPIPKPPPRPGRSRAASALEEDSINDVLLDMPNESTPAVSSGTADMMPTMRDFVLPRPGPGPSKPGDKKPEPPKRPNPGGSR